MLKDYFFPFLWGITHIIFLFFYLKSFFGIKNKQQKADYIFLILCFMLFSVIGSKFSLDWRFTIVSLIFLSIPISQFFVNSFAFQWIYISLYFSIILIVDYLFSYIGNKEPRGSSMTDIDYYFEILKLAAICLMIYFIYRFKKKNARTRGIFLPLILFPFCSYLLLFYFYGNHQSEWASRRQSIFLLAIVLGMNTLYFMTIEKMEMKHYVQLNRDNFAKKDKLYKEQYYEKLEKQQEEIRFIRHDMKNQLIGVLGKLEDQKPDVAHQELAKILSQISLTEQLFYTKNTNLNTILNFKAEEMKRKNIGYEFHIKIPEQVKMDGKDMGLLIGNILDNAIEACEKCVGKKNVQLQLIYYQHTLTMTCENSTDGNVLDLSSRKEHSLSHGLGIKSIKILVKEYGGEADFMIFPCSFRVQIIMWNV